MKQIILASALSSIFFLPTVLHAQSRPNVEASIDEVAIVLAVANPAKSAEEIKRVFIARVNAKGVRVGFALPTLVAIDAAIIAHQPLIAKLLLSPIQRLYPKSGLEIQKLIQLNPISFDSPDGRSSLIDLNRQTIEKMGFGSSEAQRMMGAGAIEDAFQKSSSADIRTKFGIGPDSSGRSLFDRATGMSDSKISLFDMTAAIFGEKSLIHQSVESNDSRSRRRPSGRSPIFGMSRDDVRQCFSNCQSTAESGASSGKQVGKYAGAAIGTILGAEGGAIGAYAGYEIGRKGGADAGELVGYGVGMAVCGARKCAGEATEEEKKSQPVTQTPPPSKPTTPEPKPDSEHQEKPDRPSPTPKATDDKPEQNQCRIRNCETARPTNTDDDSDGGVPQVDDTGHGAPRVFQERTPLVWGAAKIPFINPVRDPESFDTAFSKTGGL